MKRLKLSNQGFFGRGGLLPRLLLLTSLKEGWLFLANAYGLFFHPRRSLKKITDDRSQLTIFVSVPVVGLSLLALLLVIIYLAMVKFSP